MNAATIGDLISFSGVNIKEPDREEESSIMLANCSNSTVATVSFAQKILLKILSNSGSHASIAADSIGCAIRTIHI